MAVFVSSSFVEAVENLSPDDRERVGRVVDRFFAGEHLDAAGLNLEKLVNGRSFWSARVSDDLRIIFSRDGPRVGLHYAGHHDRAYRWADAHDVRANDVTGMTQLIRDPGPGVAASAPAAAATAAPARDDGLAFFTRCSRELLLQHGVPPEWVPRLLVIDDADTLEDVLADAFEHELADRLLAIALGEDVPPPRAVLQTGLFAEQLALSSDFAAADDVDELRRMLDAPSERWIGFLHPTQRRAVDATFPGPSKVTGAAGTGKTVVAMHRARRLAREGRRVLLVTFSTTLTQNIDRSLTLLCSPLERQRIKASTLDDVARQILDQSGAALAPVGDEVIRDLLPEADAACPLDKAELYQEWKKVISPLAIRTLAAYLACTRSGRGRPMAAAERTRVWPVFERVLARLAADGHVDYPGMNALAAERLAANRTLVPWDALVVDEVQDFTPAHLELVKVLGGSPRPDSLTLIGDPGQRIYAGAFSLRRLGIAVQGRAHVLRVNYRTTYQIKRLADRLLGRELDDLDEGHERRDGVRSVLKGPVPQLRGFASLRQEVEFVLGEARSLVASGIPYEDIAVLARSAGILKQVEAQLAEAKAPFRRLAEGMKSHVEGKLIVGTLHRSKGLEFRAVFLVAIQPGQLPNYAVLRELSDPLEQADAIQQERQLLYVGMTRARHVLHVSWHRSPCEFLKPLLA